MMQLVTSILENIMVMALTLVVLAGGFYLLLLVLNLWLRIKTGTREKEGLANLWASTMKEAKLPHSRKEPPEP
jgi:threonine/homoserine/homoserine lactone efflux protein